MQKEFHTDPADLIVGIGPSIHKESYIFPSPTIQENNPNWQPYLTHLPDNQTSIDLTDYNRDQLINAGVPKSNIEISLVDTNKDPNFFSHYRSKRTNEPEGRFMTVISMT